MNGARRRVDGGRFGVGGAPWSVRRANRWGCGFDYAQPAGGIGYQGVRAIEYRGMKAIGVEP
ncbi:MAG: hypothetical protein WA949_00670 [Phormidesmis sp.]